MPPCALHQAIMSLMALPISWSRPGTPAKPLSSLYAMLIVELDTPLSVAPVACPFPQGEGSVPNEVVEMEEDDAPDADVGTITPAAVSVVSSRANTPARMPMILFIIDPPVLSRGLARSAPGYSRRHK